ncbi:MAG: hypothetical protein P0S95_07255 [Rhabdochlamydiaceae bacterium]|nr:hypothetical protein [Candidatus Amphrikana amoebophyrae]
MATHKLCGGDLTRPLLEHSNLDAVKPGSSRVTYLSDSEVSGAEPKSSINWKKVAKVALIVLAVLAFIALNVVTFGSVFHVGLAVSIISTVAAKKILIGEGVAIGISMILVARNQFKKAMRNYSISKADIKILNNPDHQKHAEVKEKYFERLLGGMWRIGIWELEAKELGGKEPSQCIRKMLWSRDLRVAFLKKIEDEGRWPALSCLDIETLDVGDKSRRIEDLQLAHLHNKDGSLLKVGDIEDLPEKLAVRVLRDGKFRVRIGESSKEIKQKLSMLVGCMKKAGYKLDFDVTNKEELTRFLHIKEAEAQVKREKQGKPEAEVEALVESVELVKQLSEAYGKALEREDRKESELEVADKEPLTSVQVETARKPSGLRETVLEESAAKFTQEDVIWAHAIFQQWITAARAMEPGIELTPEICSQLYVAIAVEQSPEVADAFLAQVLKGRLRQQARVEIIDFFNAKLETASAKEITNHLWGLFDITL